MAEVTLHSIRASVLCVGDAGIIFQPGERRVFETLTPGLQRAVDMGWLLRENGKAKASREATETTQDTGEEQAQPGDDTKKTSGADASLFPSIPESFPVTEEKPQHGGKGKQGRQGKPNQNGGSHAAE